MRRLVVSLLLAIAACTAPLPPASQKVVVYFQEWSAALDDNAQSAITSAAKWAAANPTLPLTVSGYADPEGSKQANIDLSRTRAQVVKDQLVTDGVSPDRIVLTAYGSVDFAQSSIESRRVAIGLGGS
jgi:outer membrane protein OmpA-like peptidoglycan-associated protein